MDREELVARIRACTECSIGRLGTRLNAVPAERGDRFNGLAVLGEAPGAVEDETGRPFVGRTGQLLERLLSAAGLSRQDVLLLNRVRCRPPKNSLVPHKDAVPKCDPLTAAELALYDPSVVLVMGATAMQGVFGVASGIKVGELRGTIRRTGPDHPFGARVWVATYHPASLLRPTGKANIPLVQADILLAIGEWKREVQRRELSRGDDDPVPSEVVWTPSSVNLPV